MIFENHLESVPDCVLNFHFDYLTTPLISIKGALRLPMTYDNDLIPSQSHPSVRHKASKSSEQASDLSELASNDLK